MRALTSGGALLIFAVSASALGGPAAQESSETLSRKLTEAKVLLGKATAGSPRRKIFDRLRTDLKKEEEAAAAKPTDDNRALRMSLVGLNQYFAEIHPEHLSESECQREKARIEFLGHPPGAAAGEILGEAAEAIEFVDLLCGPRI